MNARNDAADREREFSAMYERHFGRVLRFFRAHTRSKEDAADLAQEAFVRVHARFEQYRGEGEWTYLQTVARNLLINFWRERSAAKRSGQEIHIETPDIAAELPKTEQPDYGDEQEKRQRQQRLQEAVRALSSGQRQVILLQMDGFTYEEIADALEISLDAVKSRRRDAVRALKNRLGDDVAMPEEER
ncbi:MAG TPA: RNA polymerase sigma factor [Thermoanaerobaculia bacterium]|nr:RNA polymerase sigma factor [Thermoanaerobaculia bacterium]